MVSAQIKHDALDIHNNQKRILLIDCLRAIAIFGVFMAHMFEQYEIYWGGPIVANSTNVIMTNFIMGKSFSLLAVCFGLSEYMLIESLKAKGENYYGVFAWRMVILFVIGLFHSMLYRGDILQVMAPLGIIFMFFDKLKSNKLLIILAIFLFLQPYLFYELYHSLNGAEWAKQVPGYMTNQGISIYKSGDFIALLQENLLSSRLSTLSFFVDTGRIMLIFGLFLIGLYLGRIGFFKNPDKYLIPRRIIMFTCLIIGAVIFIHKNDFINLLQITDNSPRAKEILGYILGGIFDVSIMFFYLLLFVDFYQNGAKRLFDKIAPVGRMTLSFYILQSLIFVPIFYNFGLGGYKFIPENIAIIIGIAFVLIQIIIANIWFRHFYFGPLEWVWRSLTYFKLMPFKR